MLLLQAAQPLAGLRRGDREAGRQHPQFGRTPGRDEVLDQVVVHQGFQGRLARGSHPSHVGQGTLRVEPRPGSGCPTLVPR